MIKIRPVRRPKNIEEAIQEDIRDILLKKTKAKANFPR